MSAIEAITTPAPPGATTPPNASRTCGHAEEIDGDDVLRGRLYG